MKKILVANRGEIALRVMRTAREMGISTVAVFSEADRNMPFVRFADEAICIGPALSAQSYLRGDHIISIAREMNVDGIHPGYGFLSENAAFSKSVEDAGMSFIGPSAHSIAVMGSKISAKRAAKSFGVPMVPGTEDPIESVQEAKEIAKEIGYPVLIKASAGGGGKGMRVVKNESEIAQQMQRAQSEALSAFGNADVFMEKYVTAPRHIEIQILGDKHGNYVHLFERECSIQRRHQKLIEEAPSGVVNETLRQKMGVTAIAVARSCKYYGAGTVEFLVDDQLNYYFLEMNTRLQVEHCVTEMITGIDLVREQINIAKGEPLSFSQQDISIRGHAIELRVCAEDPENDFLPDTGLLSVYKPAKGPGIRVDDGFEAGLEVPVFYDSMIAKLIAHAGNRQQAIDRLCRAIDEFQVSGIKTTLSFGKWALQTEQFRNAQFDTGFIDKFFQPALLQASNEENLKAAALLAAQQWSKSTVVKKSAGTINPYSSWRLMRNKWVR